MIRSLTHVLRSLAHNPTADEPQEFPEHEEWTDEHLAGLRAELARDRLERIANRAGVTLD